MSSTPVALPSSVAEYVEQGFLHNKKKARCRIRSECRLSGVNDISDLILTPNDFSEARKMLDQEAKIVFGDSSALTEQGLFRGVVYCFLTTLQNYDKQITVFERIIQQGFDTPEAVLRDPTGLLDILNVIFKNQKAGYIRTLAQNWEGLDLLAKISAAVKTSREDELALRAEVISKVNGLREKTSSVLLRMCGAEYLVPIDSWMAEILYLHGYSTQMPRRTIERPHFDNAEWHVHQKRKAGLRGAQYLRAEEQAADLAVRYGVPGYLLQLTYWTKHSTYQKTLS